MAVHSFSPDDLWFDSFIDFVHYVSQEHNSNLLAVRDQFIKDIPLSSGIDLYLGWIKGDEKYLHF